MKLTKKDRKYLKGIGYLEEDMKQIQKATAKIKTVYELNDEKISREKAIEILGREEYINGIARSAFHWSAVRSKDEDEIYFNSSRLFK